MTKCHHTLLLPHLAHPLHHFKVEMVCVFMALSRNLYDEFIRDAQKIGRCGCMTHAIYFTSCVGNKKENKAMSCAYGVQSKGGFWTGYYLHKVKYKHYDASAVEIPNFSCA